MTVPVDTRVGRWGMAKGPSRGPCSCPTHRSHSPEGPGFTRLAHPTWASRISAMGHPLGTEPVSDPSGPIPGRWQFSECTLWGGLAHPELIMPCPRQTGPTVPGSLQPGPFPSSPVNPLWVTQEVDKLRDSVSPSHTTCDTDTLHMHPDHPTLSGPHTCE